jgi:hypothetical protein
LHYLASMERDQSDLPRVSLTDIQPSFTLTVLRMLDDDAAKGFSRLLRELKRLSLKSRQGIDRSLVADGIEPAPVDAHETYWIFDNPYEAAAFISKRESAPPWATEDFPFKDISHNLTVLLRRGILVAVYGDSSLLGTLQSWLDKNPYPPYRRISEGILNAAFLKEGEARTMWLRGVHAPRSTKANTSHLGGPRLQDALLHAVHSSFTIGAARSLMPTDANLQYLRGVIGVNPAKSQIWLNRALKSEQFLGTVADALALVERIADEGITLDNPYPVLSSPAEGLKGVKGAFDIVTLPSSEIGAMGTDDEELLKAADLLEDAFIEVRAVPNSSSFLVDVGEDGKIGGTLTGRVALEKKSISLKFGLSGEPTYLSPVRRILDALDLYADDLVTVYYESGHTAQMGHIYKQNIRSAAFPNWIFLDFAGFDISREKPDTKKPQEIHDWIGSTTDISLFSWVAERFNDGYLTCDDGSGEIADFIYLSNEGDVTLIHVKGAKQNHPNRLVAVGPYEVVVSQAEKNVKYLTRDSLLERLRSSPVGRPATWNFGERVDDRSDFLLLLATLDSRMRFRVLVVQPHISKVLYDRVQRRPEDESPLSPEALRMELLESMLNIARAGVVGSNADLFVVGSLA